MTDSGGHPIMFSDDDPMLIRVREIALGFPGADVKISHGRPAFFTKKVFCYYGGSIKVDGSYQQHEQSIIVGAEADERPALVEDPRCYVPAYLGAYGWVGIDLDADTDWTEVTELIDASYRLTAGKRLIAELDLRRAG
ncbi:MmcQ/YjbR family DNA-binding protein [Granulicoccus phenolivorans]|uniref:MmcQ/YjbR family DNA-binding protein n=1 Tax=Granulicoccus phenolivorans TaxID=266854 RepID=UPI0004198280|nr:MmcQ/YjbR family DNA-binding protein [Granulicoccus phenolivorans]